MFDGFKVVRQLDSMDCGPACILMICKHYGLDISISKIRRICGKSKYGTSLLNLNNCAKDLGFSTSPVRLTFERFAEKVNLPCVVHWSKNHFVVVYKIDEKHVWIADPFLSKVKMTYQEFNEVWKDETGKGVALQLIPTIELETHNDNDEKDYSSLKRLLFHCYQYKRLFGQLLIVTFVISILNLMMPFILQALVDTGIKYKNIDFIYVILIAQLLLFTSRILSEYIRSRIVIHAGTRINVRLASEFVRKLCELPISFFDTRNVADILQRLLDFEKIEQVITQNVVLSIFGLLNLVVFSLVIVSFDVKIFLVFVLGSSASMAWVFFFLNSRRKLDYKYFSNSRDSQSSVIQIVNGMQDLRTSQAHYKFQDKWLEIQSKIFQIKIDTVLVDHYQRSGVSFINEIKNIMITFYAAVQVVNGDISIGAMMAIIYIIGQMNAPIEHFSALAISFQEAKIALERSDEVHNHPVESNFCTLDAIPRGDIMLSGMSFKYNHRDKDNILTDINVKIESGKTTAIVGPSGSGKSTLLKLLLRFYEPTAGSIQVGETMLARIPTKGWLSKCATVFQNGYLFSETVAENIALCSNSLDMDRVIESAKKAEIHNEIQNFPLGYHTKIGVDGHEVSGGQKQRILLARALYSEPDYIFLDEATSSLDANNERLVQLNLIDSLAGKTVIVVAHRLSTIINADKIIMLEGGRIKEIGTHVELMEKNGAYSMLFKNQMVHLS